MTYHKEGPACGRIPCDPASSVADCEYPLDLPVSFTTVFVPKYNDTAVHTGHVCIIHFGTGSDRR